MRKILIPLLVAVLALPALGANFKKGKIIEVSNIKGDLYASGEELIAKGIQGDVLFFGRKARLWDVDGGIFFLGEKLVLNGSVARSVRFLGRALETGGKIQGDILFAGQELRIEKEAEVDGEIYAGGDELDIFGKVAGKVNVGGNEVILGGTFLSDVKVKAQRLIILPEAKIEGNLEYWTPKQIEVPEGAVVGKITYHKYSGKKVQKKPEKEAKEEKKVEKPKKRGFFLSGAWFKVSWFISSLVLGYIFLLLFPGAVRKLKEEILGKPLKALLLGAAEVVAFVVVILGFFVLIYTWMVSVFAIPLFLMGLYLAKLLAALAIGSVILKWISKKEISPWLSYPLGLILIAIIGIIPYIGWLLCLILRLWGFGAFLYRIRI